MRSKVLISVPNEGWIHKSVCFVTDKLLADRRYQVSLIRPTHRPYENNLHHIVNDFMAGDYHYWLNIDSDNPPVNNPLDLVALDLDIVGLPTPVFHWTGEKKGERPFYWNGYKLVSEEEGFKEWSERKGLQEVDASGTGCFMVSRRVFNHPEMRKAPFQRICKEDGTVEYGNDLAFSMRARKCGFKIHMHYDYPCDHHHEIPFLDMIRGFGEMKRG